MSPTINKKIQELALKSYVTVSDYSYSESRLDAHKFAELIIKDVHELLQEHYQETPLELCGPLLDFYHKLIDRYQIQ